MNIDLYEIVLQKTFHEQFFPNDDTRDFIGNIEHKDNPFNKIKKSILNKIQNKKLILVIKLINEGDIDDDCIKILEMLLKKHNIPIEYFIFVHDSYKLPNTKIRNYKHNTHMFFKSDESINLFNSNKLNSKIFKNKKYKFHLPIKRFRYHRLLLLDKLFLKYENFIEQNLVSFNIDTENNKNLLKPEEPIQSIDSYSHLIPEKISINLIEYMLSNIFKFIDKSMDNSDIDIRAGYNCEFKETYENSYFTIVTETFFFEDYYYASEKIFQPIAHMHPFIVLGRPGILQYLKENGFKTFHPYIDESYDLESDNDKRFDMVYNEVCRLNELSNIECDDMLDNIKDILEYNQKHLLQMNGITGMTESLANYMRNTIKNSKNLI